MSDTNLMCWFKIRRKSICRKMSNKVKDQFPGNWCRGCCKLLLKHTTSDFLVKISLLYNWILVNHYSLVSSLSGLHNQGFNNRTSAELLSHNTTGAPWPRYTTQVCSSILRDKKEEREMKWSEEVHFPCHMPAVHPPEAFLASAVLQMQKCLRGLYI